MIGKWACLARARVPGRFCFCEPAAEVRELFFLHFVFFSWGHIGSSKRLGKKKSFCFGKIYKNELVLFLSLRMRYLYFYGKIGQNKLYLPFISNAGRCIQNVEHSAVSDQNANDKKKRFAPPMRCCWPRERMSEGADFRDWATVHDRAKTPYRKGGTSPGCPVKTTAFPVPSKQSPNGLISDCNLGVLLGHHQRFTTGFEPVFGRATQ